ncbi:MAG: hypothetical protein JO086_04275 [Acidimicrobiia bacterium]|nr:hypothetical protein [Acidimicrobiia bacterium]
MPKTIKGLAGRTPPVPSADPDAIAEWCRRQMPDLQPLVMQLDELIRGTVQHLDLALQRNRAFYGLPNVGWIIELAPYAVSVNVLFFGGADFPSPPPLGTTDRTRYIKLTGLDDEQRLQLRSWIKLAARTPGWL